jgi:hypothetical protein
MAVAVSAPRYLPEVFNHRVEDLQNPPAFDSLYPAWGYVALGAIATATAAVSMTGILGIVVVIFASIVGTVVPLCLSYVRFIELDPTYLDSAKSVSERMILALAKAHLLGLGHINALHTLEGVFLGAAIAAGISLALTFSAEAFFVGLLALAGTLLAAYEKEPYLTSLPRLREDFAKIYDSLMRSVSDSEIPQDETFHHPIGPKFILQLRYLYDGILDEGGAFIRQEFEDFFEGHPESLKEGFKHLLPWMDKDTIRGLIQRYPELSEPSFFEDCQALHPSRMP